jgi:hypothetical protein
MEAKTLFDKIWDAHAVKQVEGRPCSFVHRPPPDS